MTVDRDHTPDSEPSGLHRIRNPRDFYGGLVLAALALFALWASRTLEGSRGAAFGPGTAPRLFAGLMLIVGIVVALLGAFTRGARVGGYAMRGPLLIFASVLMFAATIRTLGLVVATFATILIAAAASAETRWREAVVWAAIISAACALLFPYALGLPLPLWPRR